MNIITLKKRKNKRNKVPERIHKNLCRVAGIMLNLNRILIHCFCHLCYVISLELKTSASKVIQLFYSVFKCVLLL